MFCSDESDWAEQVFGRAQLGDSRRTARLVRLASLLAKDPALSVDAACGDDTAEAEGAHRLVRNGNFSSDSIFDAGAMSTAKSAADTSGDLLALEDSTTLSFPHNVAKKLGDTGGKKGSKKNKGGWWVHSVILVAAERHIPLGLIYQERWCRPHGQRGKKHQRRNRAYEQKESFKWEKASRDMDRRLRKGGGVHCRRLQKSLQLGSLLCQGQSLECRWIAYIGSIQCYQQKYGVL